MRLTGGSKLSLPSSLAAEQELGRGPHHNQLHYIGRGTKRPKPIFRKRSAFLRDVRAFLRMSIAGQTHNRKVCGPQLCLFALRIHETRHCASHLVGTMPASTQKTHNAVRSNLPAGTSRMLMHRSERTIRSTSSPRPGSAPLTRFQLDHRMQSPDRSLTALHRNK